MYLEVGVEIGGRPKLFRCDFAAKITSGPVLRVQNFLLFNNRAFKKEKSILKKFSKFTCKIASFWPQRRMAQVL